MKEVNEMPNYRTNPNFSRNTGYSNVTESPYSRAQHRPTVMPEIQPSDELAELPLAMAYVPMQQWKSTFEIDEALSKGTIFPDLYKPFLGGNCNYDTKNRY